jgi:hypothetical protein
MTARTMQIISPEHKLETIATPLDNTCAVCCLQWALQDERISDPTREYLLQALGQLSAIIRQEDYEQIEHPGLCCGPMWLEYMGVDLVPDDWRATHD